MIAWFKGRTILEGSLLVSQLLTLVALVVVLNWWRQELIPWSTDFGTVAAWVGACGTVIGAFGTVSGIFFAVHSFRTNTTADREKAERLQEREAQKVVTTWHTALTPNADPERGRNDRELVGTIHNFGSGPVRNVSLFLDIPSKDRQWSEVSGELRQSIPVIAPGGMETVRFGVGNQPFGLWHRMYAEGMGLERDTVVEYTDEHGTKWESRNGVANRAMLVEGSTEGAEA